MGDEATTFDNESQQKNCFECLQKRIESDLSNRVLFCYGVSDSPLPFGSTAVCQVINSFDRKILANGTAENRCEKDKPTLSKINGNQIEVNLGVFEEEDEALPVSENESHACDDHTNFCEETISALAPSAYAGYGSYKVIEELLHRYVSGSFEHSLMLSLILLLEGKSSKEAGTYVSSLLGLGNHGKSVTSRRLRHPNIAPIIGTLQMPGYINLILPKAPYTLENILHYSPEALKSDWHIRFLMYQLLSALAYLHSLGATHGILSPSSVKLTDSFWCWLSVLERYSVRARLSLMNETKLVASHPRVSLCHDNCPCSGLYADLRLTNSSDWQRDFKMWWNGELSNYEYLLILNRLAGRRWGDPTFHTVMPWVIDFSVKPDESSDAGWRDLRKSKWRLAKGDEQLDFTYSTSEIPHHVSDECLSELAVCSYKARRLPLSILRSSVRSVYEPNEYPSTMQRLYQWTPDECIPEFYTDPRIFSSVHDGMSNLAVPSWADSPEEFISLHRAALESDRVSQEINHWFDITFGYKLSGEAAVVAKNVTLPSSEPQRPRSSGRCQLFTQPHPKRQRSLLKKPDWLKPQQEIISQVQSNCDIVSTAITEDASSCIGMADESMLEVANNLEQLERTMSFCEQNRHLSPCYNSPQDCTTQGASPELPRKYDDLPHPSDIDLNTLLEYFNIVDDGGDLGFQELLLWKQKSSHQRSQSEDVARDMFSVGCLLAELYLKRPLFDPVSLVAYTECGLLPGLFQKLPPHVAFLVEECIQKDWKRRPSAYCLLESPYFPQTVRSAYLFVAPLHLLTSNGSRLQFAAKLAGEGALRLMGPFAAEMCMSYCMPLVMSSLSDSEAEWASFLLKEFLRCLKPQAVIVSVLPVIQRVLQSSEYSHLKVLLLQNSFMREVWKIVGKRSYLQKIHPLIISNLYLLAHKNSASSASVLLIASCEELGIPVTIHQTILPLINCFGKGLVADGIDSLVRIGGIFGGNFIVRQVLPLMRNVISSCIELAHMNNPEPLQSWNSLALINGLDTLDGLVALLPREVILKELVQDQAFLHVKILMHPNIEQTVLQVAGTTLLSICQKIGPDLTASHVLAQLRDLFDELAFSQETTYALGSESISGEDFTGSRAELLLLLYPSLASLLGIEKFRRCCTTWLLLEQYLYKHYNWKWEHTGETCRAGCENSPAQIKSHKPSSYEYNPAKLLLNGVGWSIPQSQGARSGKSSVNSKSDDVRVTSDEKTEALPSSVKPEPWFWFPSSADNWDGPDFLNRTGGLKDELPWKIRASILYTVRAHPGALRVLSVADDECTVFSGGVGSGFKGVVHQWELSSLNCISGYFGHEEVVNDICILSSTERIASCDGTIHIWNSQTGKLLSCFSEPSATSLLSGSSSAKKVNNEGNGVNPAALSAGILSTAFNGSLYTCMHYLGFNDKLLAGMGNGSLRFLDIAQDQKLHLWKSQTAEPCFSSLVSAICSCGSDNHQSKAVGSPSWVAAGLNSGHIRLLDARSGNIVALWRAHDGFITKLAAPEGHLLVSSSLDRTMSVWDLRRNPPNQRYIFSGHSGGVSGFSIWGQDMISVSGNKIGLSSLCHSEDRHQQVIPRKLYTSDRGARNMSALSSIDILPFSRLFVVGTEDGFLKICC
ncbi:GFS12 protein [Nymphaea thermarum]|nr:GFS12 protein [Nymphaea thermarum]